MNSILKTIITVALGVGVLGAAQASATSRPDYCPRDHDHRSHSPSYYDYYDSDRHYRSKPRRSSRRDYDRRYNRGYDDYYRPRSKVVHRQTYQTRYRARIKLVEEIYWTRSGRKQLVCSVLVRGPDAYHVPHRRLRRIANRDCSPRARIQYL